MLKFQIGSTTVHLGPLFVFFGILAVIVLIAVADGLILGNKCRKIWQARLSEDYDYIINNAPKLIKKYKGYNKRRTNIQLLTVIDGLNFSLAMAYYSKNEKLKFLEHINEISVNENIKHFWLSLYCLETGEAENAKSHYDLIEDSEEMKDSREFLQALFLKNEGRTEEAEEKTRELIGKFQNPLIVKLAKEMIGQ